MSTKTHEKTQVVRASEVAAGDVIHLHGVAYEISQVTRYQMARFGQPVFSSAPPDHDWPVLHFYLPTYGGIVRFPHEEVTIERQ